MKDNKDKHGNNKVDPNIPTEYQYCDICGTAMYEYQCKYICPNCGNRVDCSDH